MKRILPLLLLAAALLTSCGKSYDLHSPDGRMTVHIERAPLSYTLSYDGTTVAAPSELALMLADSVVWNGGRCLGWKMREVSNTVCPVVGKNDEIADEYRELVLDFGDYTVIFRAYNEGFAYRFVANGSAWDSLVVMDELAEFRFPTDPAVIFGETNNLTAWELSNTVYPAVSAIDSGKYAITPTVFTDSANAMTWVVAESDLHAYPGMYLQKQEDCLRGYWARSPKKVVMGSWGNFVTVVAEREESIATVPANHAFPWRIIIPTKDDKSLLNNELIYLLAEPCKISDTSWIKPGKSTWEWWHCAIVEDPALKNRKASLSTDLYKYYIDFASENGLEYLLIDAGWNNLFRPTELNPDVDIHEIIRYGKEKNVGVWLWMVASTLIQNHDCYLDTVSAWGAAGVKIDFFDRDDDMIMREYDALAKACAERHLLVDFHGCSKPTGLNRAYPNVLNYEAVRGMECMKWDTSTNPDYRMQFVFGRMLAGSMDYTPGSMRNVNPDKFRPIDPGLPVTLGTRAQELAMYVVFDDYFAMLCDSPDAYRKDSTVLRFLQKVPTVWNKTLPLDAKVGEKAVVAKRTGERWYVGGMCGWRGAEAHVEMSFLEPGTTYTMTLYADADDCAKDASHYSCSTSEVTSETELDMTMASGGGFVMVIEPNK